MSPPPEAALVADVLPRVRAFARARLRDPVLAEDFAQEALALTLVALREGRLDEPDRAAGWVLGVCRNLLRSDWRARQRRQRLEALAEAAPPDAAIPEPGDPWYRLGRCLGRLQDRSRRVLQLTYVEERDSGEIGLALGMTASHVRVTRKRALAALRGCLEGRDD